MSGAELLPVFPSPEGGASMLLAFRPLSKYIVIIGSGNLAASRAFSALDADCAVIVIARGGHALACEELRWRADRRELEIHDFDSLPGPSASNCLVDDADAVVLDSFVSGRPDIALVCVTDTILSSDSSNRRTHVSANHIYRVCRTRNIPVNVTDMPDLCDFTFAASHRFIDPDSGQSTPLQIGVSTNGHGCRLTGRIRREIVSRLPKDIGVAVTRVGQLRSLARTHVSDFDGQGDDHENASPNRPVPQRNLTETEVELARRRMRWVGQVSEFWPLPRLARMTADEMLEILDLGNSIGDHADSITLNPSLQMGNRTSSSLHSLALTPPAGGKILLVGSGPGHPSLLTLATHEALTKHADLVLSDKLVPAAVLALIPAEVEVRIARKFPGNADGAQNELMEAAIEAAKQGKTVVRLKQGDPMLYGRAGEEILYFRSHGFEPLVIPGVSSALAGPMFAGIPVTQRGVSESLIVCTGVGRQGKEVRLPGYVRSRTLVILMGVARLQQILDALGLEPAFEKRDGPSYPAHLPVAVIERASMPDQRVISSTLGDVAAALESVSEQRPPGMLVVGWAVLALWGAGEVEVLTNGAVDEDEERVIRWLGKSRWRIQEGLDVGWEQLI